MSSEVSDAMDELLTTSSDSTHSSYEAADDLPETNPPMGPQVIETRGHPDVAAPQSGGGGGGAKAPKAAAS